MELAEYIDIVVITVDELFCGAYGLGLVDVWIIY